MQMEKVIPMDRKGDVPMWMISMIITLIVILVILFIIARTGDFNNTFIDFLSGWF